MEDLKTIQSILEQKKVMEDEISSMVEGFLRANPEVKNLNFTTDVYTEEMMCRVYKEFHIRINVVL